MSKARASYKIYYLQGGRWRVTPTNLRLVKAYKVFYGKKLVVKPQEFSPRTKSAAQKREFLKRLIRKIETVRLKALKKRRDQRQRKLAAESRERLEEFVDGQLEKPIKQTLTEEEIGIVKGFRESKKQVPQFEKTESVMPVDARRATIDDTLLIPIAPDGQKYTKQIVDKMVTSPELGKYHLAILDIDLLPEAYVEMTEDNFDESYSKALQILYPSLADYFMEVKRSSQLFILRIKFLNNWSVGMPYEPRAISYYRKELSKVSQLAALFEQTFRMMFGPRDAHDKTTKGKLRAKYLDGDKKIYITGATLEATTM